MGLRDNDYLYRFLKKMKGEKKRELRMRERERI